MDLFAFSQADPETIKKTDALDKKYPVAQKKPYFAIKDDTSQVFQEAFPAEHSSQAVRSFQSVCKSGKGEIGEYPDQFSLYYVGEFNKTTGVFEPLAEPEFVVGGKALANWAKREEQKSSS